MRWSTCWRIVRRRFRQHPSVEVVSRDRAGLYAEAAREGAPQARQVADRFHLLQNFRETVERQLRRYEAPVPETRISPENDQVTAPPSTPPDCASDVAEQTRLMRRGRLAARQQLFDEIRALFEGGNSIGEIARKLGLGRRRVERWVRRIDLPDRNTMASTPSNPAYFVVLLERRWAEGITKVRHLFAGIRHRGYTGSFSHLARFLSPWRSGEPSLKDADQEEPAPVRVRMLDPMTGRVISPLTAAALCVKPRGQMSARQVITVDALKAASPEFTAMRRLAMRFRGLLRGGTVDKLDAWLIAARASGILRNAAIREGDSPGHRSCSQRRVGAVEQRADRRTDQQAEDPQASHVWPRQRRPTPRSHGAAIGRDWRQRPPTTLPSAILQPGGSSNPRAAAQNVLSPLLRRTQRKRPAPPVSRGAQAL